jgi:acyl dehydratase
VLPGIKHEPGSAPDLVFELRSVTTDRDHLARYNAICGYPTAEVLPPLYPHFAAFGLHLSLLTAPSFPFAPMGIVHLRNRLVHRRPLGVDEKYDLSVRAGSLRPHPKGQLIDLTTTASVGGQAVWEETMTIFNRGRDGTGEEGEEAARSALDGVEAPPSAMQWKLSGDLGRRFAAISGDRNPIHLHPLTAKPFGFPSNIAHGMWTQSRGLAALVNRLPGAFQVDAEFRKPVLLPSTVSFGFTSGGLPITFGLKNAKKPAIVHLVGRVTEL